MRPAGSACPGGMAIPPARSRPLTSWPQVPQGHVDGEVAELADLLEKQGQLGGAPQTPRTLSSVPACLPQRWRAPV